MRNCLVCGADIPEEMAECPNCSANKESKIESNPVPGLGLVCPKCNKYNDPGIIDCKDCGKTLTPSGFTGFMHIANIPRNKPQQQESPTSKTLDDLDFPQPGRGTLSFGVLEPGRAKLEVVRGIGFEGSEFRLNSTSAGAGRSKGIILFPEDPFLSDLHISFFYEDGRLYLKDEASTGGTFLSISEPILFVSDFEISIGETRLRIECLQEQTRHDKPLPLGAPFPTEAIRVEEILCGNRPGRAWICHGPQITFGREQADIALFEDSYVDEWHAEIQVGSDGLVLIDHNSTDKTFYRVPPEESVLINHEDRVRIGTHILKVVVAN